MELERFHDLPDIPDDDEGQPEKRRPILEEVRSLRKHRLPNYPMFIGRDRKGGIVIPVSAVSRKHAKVYEQDGAYYVQDLGSINGTFLNDQRILDPVELHEGDRIKVSVTKEYPRGVREFTFKFPDTEEKKAKEDARDALLKESRGRADGKKILLRNCAFKISKKDLVSVLKAEVARRVALTKLEFGKDSLTFQSLIPYKAKENLELSIEHPKLTESVKIMIKVVNTKELDYRVQEHETEIVKISDKHSQLYKTMLKLSPMVCYLTSQLKE